MRSRSLFTPGEGAFLLGMVSWLLPATLHADWQREEYSLAWRAGTNVVWRFNFDPKFGKPHFHPLAAPGGPVLTGVRPEDHPWHYGLWFSWKFINGVNYWEEDRLTGRPEGATRWAKPVIEARSDGSATIRLELTYAHPSGRVEMTESRELEVSAPGAQGDYTIDWRARFEAGTEGVLLDRTPMPDEPDGKPHGGYAGLGLRLAGPPLAVSVVCSTGLVTRFENDRARPAAAALAFNCARDPGEGSGIAIFSAPINAGEDAPWYIGLSDRMRFASAAILAPKPRRLAAGRRMELHYRVAVQAPAWTPAALQSGYAEWLKATP